jgi:hypothetical protein
MFAVPDLLRRVRLGACASAAAALAVAGLVTGCSDLTEVLSLDPGGVSPTSPVARQAVAASRANFRAPRLADIPAVPTGLAPAADIKSSVVRLMGDRRSLNDLIFALPPAPTDTDRFLAGSRDVLNARALTPPPENQPALTEAFASETRTAIQPPPAPKEPAPRR